MIEQGNFNGFNRKLSFTDWRFSAAALGVQRYLDFHKLPYAMEYEGDRDVLLYNWEDICLDDTEEKYYQFVEHYFADYMHHVKLHTRLMDARPIEKTKKAPKPQKSDENKEEGEEDTENEIAEESTTVSDKDYENLLKINSICKKVFGALKFTEENRAELLQLIEDNRLSLCKETFRSGKSTYANYANSNSLGNEAGEVCRLLGYYADLGKKKKSLAFYWDYASFVAQDFLEFDFIPFAFSTGSQECFFINNNASMVELVKANDRFANVKSKYDNSESKLGSFRNFKLDMFFQTKNSAEFLDYQVEIIKKNKANDYYETVYLRQEAIDIFQKINKSTDGHIIRAINLPCQSKNYIEGGVFNEGRGAYFVPILDIVIDCVLNLKHLDFVLDMLLKEEENKSYLISQLIRINKLLYKGVDQMEPAKNATNPSAQTEKYQNAMFMDAQKSAAEVIRKFNNKGEKVNTNQKVKSFRNKLISDLVSKDYEGFSVTLLRLSEFSGVPFAFAYPLFKDFDKNKNLAYTFVNGLQAIDSTEQFSDDNAAEKTEQ